MEFFDKLSETIVSAGKDVGQKAKDVSEIAKHIMRNTKMRKMRKPKKRHRNRSTFS